MGRSRSRSPQRRDAAPRRRSRSPRYKEHQDQDRGGGRDRDSRPGRKEGGGGGGFRWKEKRKDNDSDEQPRRLERGYRKRSLSPRRESKASGSASVEDKFGIADKFGVADKFGPSSAKKSGDTDDTGKPPVRAPASAPAVASGEPMIIVHVNDRLGTKAAIPCLASDPIKLFKAQVAARIGREPHEILLKRQGERPFKDQLTLEDYGVSNGVQLDLEVDTGD